MTPTKKDVKSTSEKIRYEIDQLSDDDLWRAKPAKILELLEKGGIEITPSLRSMTSKLLSAKKSQSQWLRGVTGPADDFAITDADLYAFEEFVKMCDGFERAKKVFARLAKTMEVGKT